MKKIDLSKYTQLIAKLAWNSWKRLPQNTKSWVDIEDWIQEGFLFARQLISKFEPERKLKFITLLQTSLENHFKNKVDFYCAQKRWDGKNLPLEVIEDFFSTEFEFTISTQTLNSFLRVYWDASEELREYLKIWFLQNSIKKTCVTNQNQFRNKRARVIAKEFRLLARKYQLRQEDCMILLCSQISKSKVIENLPETMKNCTISVRGGNQW